MKKIFVATCLLMFAFIVSAQQGGGFQQQTPEQRAQRLAQQLERMKTDLTLTDKQVADIKKVYDEYSPKQTELMQKYQGGDREKMMEEFTKLNDERNAKIKPLISADQYTKYMETFGRSFGGGQRQGGGGQR